MVPSTGAAFTGSTLGRVFARLLDWSKGGHFRIAPKGHYEATRRYLPGTNVLETRFATPTGILTLTNCLPVRPPADPSSAETAHPTTSSCAWFGARRVRLTRTASDPSR